MDLIRTLRFAIRDMRDSDENSISGSIKIEWEENGQAKFKEIMSGAKMAMDALGDIEKVKKTPIMSHVNAADLLVMMASINLISVPTKVSGFGMKILRKHGFINDKSKLRHALFSGEFSKIRSVGPVTTAEACWWLINGEEE